MNADHLYWPSTLGELYVRAFHRHSDETALIDDRVELTYRQFGRRASAIVARLQEAGLRPGHSIAQLSSNKVEAVCVVAASFIAGLRYTPLHPLAGEDDLAFILEDAEIDCLVIDETQFLDVGARLAQRTPRLRAIFTHGAAPFATALPTNEAALVDRCDASPDDIALIAYTGGTTGRPKGVVHRHRSLITNLMISMSEWDWGAPARFLAVTPISHASLLFVLPVLLRGGTVVMAAGFTPLQFGQQVSRHEITTTFLVPTMIHALVREWSEIGPLPSLQTIIYGAAPIAPERLRESIEVIGPRFAQLYGQTEAPNAVCMLFKRHHDLGRLERLASCGVVLAGNVIRILRADDTEAAVGEAGELCVRGPLVMDGYWRRPDETSQALRKGWLHTGDIATVDQDGFVYLIDRARDVIVTGGFNVYPSEVENALSTHAAVKQCCVFGVPDEKWGEAVRAAVVLHPSAQVTANELIAHVRSLKGPVQTPKAIEFVGVIPVTALGKVDRRTLRAPHWEGKTRAIN
jgi:fatty-acyl-CoA synthase